MKAGPRLDAYMRQLEPAFRAAAQPLARDPVFLEGFELARACMHAYFDSTDAAEERAYGAGVNALTHLVLAARAAAPVLAELQGDRFARQIFELVLYRVLVDRGAEDLARERYADKAPRAIAARVDLRQLRAWLGIRHPEGRPPGYDLVDEQLADRIRHAADEIVKRKNDTITARSLAQAIGANEKTLRVWTRQSGLGELADIVRRERQRHGQKLKRWRR